MLNLNFNYNTLNIIKYKNIFLFFIFFQKLNSLNFYGLYLNFLKLFTLNSTITKNIFIKNNLSDYHKKYFNFSIKRLQPFSPLNYHIKTWKNENMYTLKHLYHENKFFFDQNYFLIKSDYSIKKNNIYNYYNFFFFNLYLNFFKFQKMNQIKKINFLKIDLKKYFENSSNSVNLINKNIILSNFYNFFNNKLSNCRGIEVFFNLLYYTHWRHTNYNKKDNLFINLRPFKILNKIKNNIKLNKYYFKNYFKNRLKGIFYSKKTNYLTKKLFFYKYYNIRNYNKINFKFKKLIKTVDNIDLLAIDNSLFKNTKSNRIEIFKKTKIDDIETIKLDKKIYKKNKFFFLYKLNFKKFINKNKKFIRKITLKFYKNRKYRIKKLNSLSIKKLLFIFKIKLNNLNRKFITQLLCKIKLFKSRKLINIFFKNCSNIVNINNNFIKLERNNKKNLLIYHNVQEFLEYSFLYHVDKNIKKINSNEIFRNLHSSNSLKKIKKKKNYFFKLIKEKTLKSTFFNYNMPIKKDPSIPGSYILNDFYFKYLNKNKRVKIFLKKYLKKKKNIILFYKNYFNLNIKQNPLKIKKSTFFNLNILKYGDILISNSLKFNDTSFNTKNINLIKNKYSYWFTFFNSWNWAFIFINDFYNMERKIDYHKLRSNLFFHMVPYYNKNTTSYKFKKTFKDYRHFRESSFNKNYTDMLDKFYIKNLTNSNRYTNNVYSSVSWFRKKPRQKKKLNWILIKNHYSKTLRFERKKVDSFFNLNYRYQYRLTNWLFYFKIYYGLKIFYENNCTIINVLKNSKFIDGSDNVYIILKKHLCYINGYIVSTEILPLFTNDIIALKVNWYVYLYIMYSKKIYYYDNLLTKSFMKNKFKKFKNNRPVSWDFIFQTETYTDIPYYLEMDFTTLSCIMLTEPDFNYIIKKNIHKLIYAPLASIFNLNWKYIV